MFGVCGCLGSALRLWLARFCQSQGFAVSEVRTRVSKGVVLWLWTHAELCADSPSSGPMAKATARNARTRYSGVLPFPRTPEVPLQRHHGDSVMACKGRPPKRISGSVEISGGACDIENGEATNALDKRNIGET